MNVAKIFKLSAKVQQDVEDLLAHYVSVVKTFPVAKHPVITKGYVIKGPKYLSSAARIPANQETAGYLDRINKAINLLKKNERQIIITRYLDMSTKRYDNEVCRSLLMDERMYYQVKTAGLLKLAQLLTKR